MSLRRIGRRGLAKLEQPAQPVKILCSQSSELPTQLTITPPWQRPYWYEASVQLALKDLCRLNDTVFDVGANIGGISTMVSRHVGPRGMVVAFEASPRTLSELHTNLALSHSNNVHVVSAAVSEVGRQWLPFYFGPAAVADSLVAREGVVPSAYVPTVALDDFCHETGLEPAVVKMDIEGAEFIALKGFSKTLDRLAPPLILEISSQQADLHAWLAARGYSAIDLATYLPFEARTDAPSKLHNVLYLHGSNRRVGAYREPRVEHLFDAGIDNLAPTEDGGQSLPLGQLEAGRYVVTLNVDPAGLDCHDAAELMYGVPGEILSLHIAGFGHLAKSYASAPIHLDRPGAPFFLAKRISAEQLKRFVRSVSVNRVHPGEGSWM